MRSLAHELAGSVDNLIQRQRLADFEIAHWPIRGRSITAVVPTAVTDTGVAVERVIHAMAEGTAMSGILEM